MKSPLQEGLKRVACGWVSGVIFDATGSYAAAFMNGLVWNGLNVTIVVALLIRARQRLAMA